MGLTMSKQETSAPEADSVISSKLHGRQASIRQSAIKAKAKQPMPDPAELERRFTKVLASMDLPPDKAKLLKSYDYEKKWDIICDQELREESNMQNSSLAATAIEQRVELTDDNVPTERSSKCRPKNNEAKQKISEKNLDPKLINEALHILQSSANYSKDPFFTYALNLANELRKYDPQTLAHVKRGISNIIFDADIGEFSGSNASSRMPTISLECMAQTDNSTDPLQYSPPQETSTTNFKIETTDNELS